MEANLNQFRLFTVHAEQETNSRRGSSHNRQHQLYSGRSEDAGSRATGGISPPGGSPVMSDGPRRPSAPPDDDHDYSAAGNSVDSAPSFGLPSYVNVVGGSLAPSRGCNRRRFHHHHPPANAHGMSSVSEHGEREKNANDDNDDSDDDNEFVDADDSTASTVDGSSLHRTSSGAEKNLIGALRALERTVNTHCTMLGRRLTREPTVKSVPPPPVETAGVGRASVSGGSAPKTAIRGDKVTVYIRVVFLKIGEIDTLKENFMADAFIQARWREPALDGHSSEFQSLQHIEDIEWDKFWNPKLYVENNLGEPKETVWQTLVFNSRGEATVYERRRIKGCFLENLELDEFPFDTQDLTLTITSERSESELDLEEDCSEISSINVQSFVDEQEWKLHSHVETWKRVSSKAYHNSKHKHPAFSTSCRASRRPGFFIWNIFLVMIPQSRLQLSFILLLTTITFKFVVSQTLPRISYLTYLDKYILTSMGILCGVCVWHAVVPLFAKPGYEDIARTIDMWGLIVSGSTYFMFHICFFMYIYFVALKKRRTYDQKDRDYRDRMKKLQKIQESIGLDGGATAPSDNVSNQGNEIV